jgi:hypothetical protein
MQTNLVLALRLRVQRFESCLQIALELRKVTLLFMAILLTCQQKVKVLDSFLIHLIGLKLLRTLHFLRSNFLVQKTELSFLQINYLVQHFLGLVIALTCL